MEQRASDDSHIAPLGTWILIQLAALIVGASRVPLWARFDRPTEDFALAILLVVQIGASAMLAPLVGRSGTTAAMIALSNVPFALLAAALSADSFAVVARCELYVAGWIALLAIWTIALPRHRSALSAIASAISIGGVVLFYLRNEYGPGDVAPSVAFGPIVTALALTRENVSPLPPFISLASLLFVSVLVMQIMLRRASVNLSTRTFP